MPDEDSAQEAVHFTVGTPIDGSGIPRFGRKQPRMAPGSLQNISSQLVADLRSGLWENEQN
ncbi:MAG: hypothetical protein ABR924_08305 [Terracidiphilus sp.]|jgi:hypothetical protein